MRLPILLTVIVLLLYGSAYGDYASRDDVQVFVQEMVAEHEFAAADLNKLFYKTERKDFILEAIARPAERTLKWFEYRKIFLKDTNIRGGIEFWQNNTQALARAEAEYGVPAEYIVAIIGVETRYGRITGNHRVVDALSTLAFDYPPRAKFFRSELKHFLLLAREEQRDPLELKGSYAGAMGYGQFMPSSFRNYAVDFDGDGARDIWGNTTDAIGSVANYFKRHGWQGGSPVIMKVAVEAKVADTLVNQKLELERTVGHLTAAGVKLPTATPLSPATDAKAALFKMEVESGAEYWLGLNDFYVITRYNHSKMYALAVHQLSQEIKTARLAALATR